jgi:hypothetical protein
MCGASFLLFLTQISTLEPCAAFTLHLLIISKLKNNTQRKQTKRRLGWISGNASVSAVLALEQPMSKTSSEKWERDEKINGKVKAPYPTTLSIVSAPLNTFDTTLWRGYQNSCHGKVKVRCH